MPKNIRLLAQATNLPILKCHVVKGIHYLEEDEQITLFDRLAGAVADGYTVLDWLYHPANEGSGGRAGKIRQYKQKRKGLKAGLWDVCFDGGVGLAGRAAVPPPSLRLELKVGYNDLEDEQLKWGLRYYRAGTTIAIAYTWLDAWDFIRRHFHLPLVEEWDTPADREFLLANGYPASYWQID